MIGVAVDASAPLSGSALFAAGVTVAVRYVGVGSGGKRLTAAELADLNAHGILVLGVVESTADRSNGGYAAGVADGQATLADPVTGRLPVLFATDDQNVDAQANIDYVRGFRDVVGQQRTGAYGFGAFIASIHSAGTASWFWQAGPAPSRTGTAGIVHFWQRQGGAVQLAVDGPSTPVTVVIGGVTCDLNNQLLEVPVTSPSPWVGTWPASMDEAKFALATGLGVLSADGHTVTVTVAVAQQGAWAANTDLRAAMIADQQLPAIAAQLAAIQGALSPDEAAILGAVQGADADVKAGAAQILAALTASVGGNVDVQALAAALAPLLPADATPAAIGEAVVAAFEAHLAATPTTTGGTAS